MKAILNSHFLYLLFPLYFPLALVFIFYHIPVDFYSSLFLLPFIVMAVVLLLRMLFSIRLNLDQSLSVIQQVKSYALVASIFSSIVILSGPVDIFVNGFKLMTPESYATFNGYGRYVRHISIMCWALIPIAFIFVKSRKIKTVIILYAIVFPLLIIDRNRLLMSFYTLIVCMSFLGELNLQTALRCKPKAFKVWVLLLASFLVFSILGFYRSGTDAFVVDTSGNIIDQGYLPLRALFYELPISFQQIVLYITTPIFNFATVHYLEFINQEFLISQLSPFSRESFDTYPYSPVLVSRFNVGTEFFPWLLYGGIQMVIIPVAVMLCSFFSASYLLNRFSNIFTFLIFLRISYLLLFMGFAPQFYTLLNLMFVTLMFFLWLFAIFLNASVSLPDRKTIL